MQQIWTCAGCSHALHFSALLELHACCILERMLETALCAAANLAMGTPQTTF